MSTRLAKGGRLIDRSTAHDFTFNGKRLRGFSGDTLAAALLANDQMLVGRSFKYHRPRGIVASGAEEPNALVNMGEGGRFEPNQRTTTTELFDGLTCTSQNHWPSLEFDVGVANNYVARFLPAGFYYKTFIHPRAAWKHVFEPIIRQSAGLGKVPKDRDADRYEHAYAFCDLLIVGGGIAGLQAALVAGAAGKRVWLMEQTAHWGGRAPVDDVEIDGKPADTWVKNAVQALESMKNVTLRLRCMAAGSYDHGYVLADEKIADHTPGDGQPRHRLWRIRTGQIIAATGAIERPLSFAGNDIPGVMLAAAMRDYVVNYAVSPGDRTVVVTNNDDAYRTAIALKEAGLEVPVILDARASVTGDLPARARALGIRVEAGRGIASVKGGKRVTGVAICAQAGQGAVLEEIACDAVAMSGGWSPVVHLWSHCGGKLNWDADQAHFAPDPARPPLNHDGSAMVVTAGCASGVLHPAAVLADATAAVGGEGAPGATAPQEAAMEPVWIMPQGAPPALRMKMWLDYQNDVKVSDVQLAAREGYSSVEHTKRYTTLGMATDQGKLSNINGLAVLADSLNTAIPQVGTTTFRPPYTPVPFGALAGESRGDIFQPLRKTPIHDRHEAANAYFEPVGLWRRPYCFPRPGETHEQAVHREVINTRSNLGLLDASTLGKIIVKGPDAGKFLDMLYTNVMSNLGIGKCRYGLMCNEQGFLSDDGVVARIDADTWLCHTTSGGADRIHGWMEDWLQCEWWDWQVYTANVTEQYAQIAVVGPNARKVLERLGGMDVSKETLPFMQWADGTLGGFNARVYRISFSGELSYEIAVPASEGRAFWDALTAAGAEFGVMPYGTEALHIMRAEKGFIMIGDETDGTVIPQDLNLGWAISKKKDDFLGKRGQERPFLASPDRWKLVGLEALDGSVIPDGSYAVAAGLNANGQRNTQGRITSTYYSPTLKRGIAMGLVKGGMSRLGETIEMTRLDGSLMQVKIVDPVFYDKDGEKQNV
ncbi:sarcosine oxidase subunit alpha family protein [Gemmobacter fulvus]|uniref:Sarcosine oxidase subunit alpha family protein n=1 Tax=Gemmobacter fulvus TaxID=2840474 RepID=A0A975P7M1_9RHOB|nr:sarcosine oxidase subunit alpha family protein [Gemmobacter fulvus]MBT9243923.1 sarcosine oxidase subunit alpha family protein [Gemmobacter fulvus]MDQ1849135.1 sarcosine oxidase subunit alpha family protein [Gemmobacter fulvus]QWK90842.1 sarcosine oxidase subunit alpha family protein [Gemmobacter fulvus]